MFKSPPSCSVPRLVAFARQILRKYAFPTDGANTNNTTTTGISTLDSGIISANSSSTLTCINGEEVGIGRQTSGSDSVSRVGSGNSSGSSSGSSSSSDCLTYVSESEAISGEWFQLAAAAKEWFRSKHAIEPTPAFEDSRDTDADKDSGWFSSWSTVTHAKKAPPVRAKKSEQELVLLCRDATMEAILDMQFLFSLKFFAINISGFLFEFRRCWFLLGPQAR